ncbi:MAG: bifunctional oligoribonuclease/PAP phosphatase NrnA [Flavobacteriales bacterium]
MDTYIRVDLSLDFGSLNYTEVHQLLEQPKKVVITTHKSPDGDAIGSSLALNFVLNKLGHQSVVIVPDRFPAFLNWLEGADEILIYDESKMNCISAIEAADIAFSLDYNRLERVADLGEHLKESSAVKLMIDHHIDPDDSFDHILSNTGASSTAELVHEFISDLGWETKIGVAEAECLYAGIMTDTGSFRFSSTSSKTHRVVAHLMDIGLEPWKVHQAIFDTNSYDRLKLSGYALSEKLEFIPGIRCSIITLSAEEKNRFNYQKGDTEGLVNYGLSIAGSDVAVFLSEENGMVKFSFRSKGEINVNDIAREHFSGGGHRNAAGGKFDGSLKDAEMKLKEVLHAKFG